MCSWTPSCVSAKLGYDWQKRADKWAEVGSGPSSSQTPSSETENGSSASRTAVQEWDNKKPSSTSITAVCDIEPFHPIPLRSGLAFAVLPGNCHTLGREGWVFFSHGGIIEVFLYCILRVREGSFRAQSPDPRSAVSGRLSLRLGSCRQERAVGYIT